MADAVNETPNQKVRPGIAQLKTASQLAEKRQELDKLRTADKREWSLNRAFYNRDQWVIWNKLESRVESLPINDGDKPRWKVRITADGIQPGVNHHVALLTKTRPVIRAVPNSGSDTDIKAAQLAEALYEWWWQDLKLTQKLQSALVEAQVSQGYWWIDWDELAGKPMKLMVDPTGKPITDPELQEVYRDELAAQAQQMGMDPQQLISQYEKTIYMGDIRVKVKNGFDVLVDPIPESHEDCRYAFVKELMEPDEIFARWGVKVGPDSEFNEQAAGDLPLAYRRMRSRRPKTGREVWFGYFPPQPAFPAGRRVVWIEGPDTILKDEPWGNCFPFKEIPLIHFPGIERPGSPIDDTRVAAARPVQKELNRTISQIVQHKDLMIKPQLLVPFGSLRQRLTDEPGLALEYNPVGPNAAAPEWRNIQNLPNSALMILDNIQQRLDRIFTRLPSQRDQLPARLDSGETLEQIHEAIADELTPEVRRMEVALALAGKVMVGLASKYYIEPRMVKIYGQGGAVQVKKFLGADIEGGFSFHTLTDTGLPRTRAGKITAIKELMEMNLIDPQTALKHLDLADYSGIRAQLERDEAQAYREHDKLMRGEPINVFAMQQAMQSLAQGINPDTGQPLQSPQEAQEELQEAALSPLDYENWETHVQVHGDYMKTPEFEALPPDMQQRFLQHYMATYDRMIQVKIAMASLDPKIMPKLSVAARSTVSAPVFQAILEKHGIQISPEEIEEQPLDTNVTDELRIMDMRTESDPQAPLPHEWMQPGQEMEQSEEQHFLDQASKLQDMALIKQKAEQDMALGQAKSQQEARHAEETHQEKLKQMRKPKPAPKAASGR